MCRITLSVVILCLWLHNAHQHQLPADEENRERHNHFDVLVFSQQWPITKCKYWIHKTGGHCDLPKQNNRWIIHGIWPRLVGGGYLAFCNKSWSFDPEQIKSIEDDLNQAWTNVFKESDHYSFWDHEWSKHGTCATDLESLNSEFKYFNQGVQWNLKYSLADMLEAANIFPSDTKAFKPEEFLAAVKARTKKGALVWCLTLKGVVYLDEIRVCFDKQFNLIDCEGPPVDQSCNSSTGVIYPANAQ